MSDDHTELLSELERWACHEEVVWWQPRSGDVLASDLTSWEGPLCSPHWRLYDTIGHRTMLDEWEIHPGARNLWVFFEALGRDAGKLRKVIDDKYPWSCGRNQWNHPLWAALSIAARRGYWQGLV